MCCGRRLEAEGYSSVCPRCCTLSCLGLHGKPEKGKWLKKMLRKWSQGGGKEEVAWLTKQGVRDKEEKIKEGGQSLQGIIVQAWGGLTLELKHKNILQRQRLNQQNLKSRGMP